MKRVITGGIILLSGVLLYIGVHIVAAIHMSVVNDLDQALEDTGGTNSNIIAIIMSILGFTLVIWDSAKDMWNTIGTNIKEQNEEYEKRNNTSN